MVNCSTLKKDICSAEPKCNWVLSKGCRSNQAKKTAKPAVAPAKKKTPIVAKEGMPLKGAIIVFTGFRDESLKAKIIAKGASVPGSVSGSTHMIVAKDIMKASKAIAFAKENNLPLYSIEAFAAQYKLKPSAAVKKPAAPAAKKPAAAKKPPKGSVPEGFEVAQGVIMPVNPELINPSKLTYKGKSVFSIYRQARHIVENSLTKKHKIYVRKMADFLGYSFEDKCFLYVVKITSQAPDAPKGAYDLVVAEIKYDNERWQYLGFRPMDVGVPKEEYVDSYALLKKQYKDDLFAIFKGETMFAKEKPTAAA